MICFSIKMCLIRATPPRREDFGIVSPSEAMKSHEDAVKEALSSLLDGLIQKLFEGTSDEKKPAIKGLMNYRELSELNEKAIDIIKNNLDDPDLSFAKKYNAFIEPVIKAFNDLINENV